MMTKIRTFVQARLRDQEGGISAEYVAVIVIVAALIAAVWATNIDETVGNCAEDAVSNLFSSSDEAPGLECETGRS